MPEPLEATAGLHACIVGDRPLRTPSRRRLGSYRRACSAPTTSARRWSSVLRDARATASCARRWRTGGPVVASAVGGLLDAVEDGVTGLLVPPRGPTCAASGDRATPRRRRAVVATRPGARSRAGAPLVGRVRPLRPSMSTARHSAPRPAGGSTIVPVPELFVSGRRLGGRRARVRHRRDRPQPPGRRREGEGADPRREGVRRGRRQAPEARQPAPLPPARSTTRPTTTRTASGGRTGSTEALELGKSEWFELCRYAREEGLRSSPPPSTSRARLPGRAGRRRVRSASGDLLNVPFLRRVAAVGKPMFLSTGGGTLEDVDRAVDAILPLNGGSACSTARRPTRRTSRTSTSR